MVSPVASFPNNVLAKACPNSEQSRIYPCTSEHDGHTLNLRVAILHLKHPPIMERATATDRGLLQRSPGMYELLSKFA